MTNTSLETEAHRRLNPLTGDWVLVSPQRTSRPWLGSTSPDVPPAPKHDPSCYLCPGNTRAGGVKNPRYESTFTFQNDFPALIPPKVSGAPGWALEEELEPEAETDLPELFHANPVSGECRVVCFSPRHDLTLAQMNAEEISRALGVLVDQYNELAETYEYVQIFETRGETCGSSNPHPHGQIWATSYVPTELKKEIDSQAEYFNRSGSPMLLDYAKTEISSRDRVVELNEDWVAVVPFWAYWPFETMIIPRRPVADFSSFSEADVESFAAITGSLLKRYDALFDTPFPYRSGWHNSAGKPGESSPGWQFHAHYYPPLLRSATVEKIPASFEWLAEYQRDLTPELAAKMLRAAS